MWGLGLNNLICQANTTRETILCNNQMSGNIIVSHQESTLKPRHRGWDRQIAQNTKANKKQNGTTFPSLMQNLTPHLVIKL